MQKCILTSYDLLSRVEHTSTRASPSGSTGERASSTSFLCMDLDLVNMKAHLTNEYACVTQHFWVLSKNQLSSFSSVMQHVCASARTNEVYSCVTQHSWVSTKTNKVNSHLLRCTFELPQEPMLFILVLRSTFDLQQIQKQMSFILLLAHLSFSKNQWGSFLCVMQHIWVSTSTNKVHSRV